MNIDYHYLFYLLSTPMPISIFETMARRLLPSHSIALGLSVFLFTFAFLPTLVVLLAVIVFFVFYYPRLRKSDSCECLPQCGLDKC